MSNNAALEEALRVALRERTLLDGGYLFLDAVADGLSVVVFFRYRDVAEVHAVELDATPPLTGPSTGEPCATEAEWATEAGWLLDEEVGTRDVEGRSRRVAADGVVHLSL